jgi:WD40 repeat protein
MDSDLIASVSWDQTVKLWSISQATEVATMIGHSAQLFAMDFAPDGRTLATAGVDGAIKLWDLPGLGKDRLVGHRHAPTGLAFHCGGALASAAADGVRFWDADTGRLVSQRHRDADLGHWNEVAFAPDGLAYATLNSDVEVVLVDYPNQQVRHILPHASAVSCLAYSPSGQILATGARDGTITLWQVNPASALVSWTAHHREGVNAASLENFWGQPHMVHDLAFVNDTTLLSLGADRTLRFWTVDPVASTEVPAGKKFLLNQTLPRVLALSLDREVLAVADEFGSFGLWRTDAPAQKAAWPALTENGILSLAFVPPGNTLLAGGFGGDLSFWDVRSRSPRLVMDGSTAVNAIAVSLAGDRIAWAGGDGVIRLWRIR